MQVVIEGDAKVCVDNLNVKGVPVDCSISIIICNYLELSKSFFKCKFSWVEKILNFADHTTTKLTVRLKSQFYCNKHEAPRIILDACKVDYIIVDFSFLI